MSRISKVVITTADTKEIVEYPGSAGWGDVWQIAVYATAIDPNGGFGTKSSPTVIYVTRQSLVNSGLLPVATDDAQPPIKPTKENAEQLLLKLLALVGVNPSE